MNRLVDIMTRGKETVENINALSQEGFTYAHPLILGDGIVIQPAQELVWTMPAQDKCSGVEVKAYVEFNELHGLEWRMPSDIELSDYITLIEATRIQKLRNQFKDALGCWSIARGSLQSSLATIYLGRYDNITVNVHLRNRWRKLYKCGIKIPHGFHNKKP